MDLLELSFVGRQLVEGPFELQSHFFLFFLFLFGGHFPQVGDSAAHDKSVNEEDKWEQGRLNDESPQVLRLEDEQDGDIPVSDFVRRGEDRFVELEEAQERDHDKFNS